MAHTSPTVARWELALRLKRRREELQMSVKTITDHLGFSRNYWSMVENEKANLADDKFKLLMELFDFDSATAAELDTLRIEGRKRSWWTGLPGADQLDEETQRLFGLERGATRIQAFEALLVPGLLQTPEYARAYIESDPMVRPVDVGNMVSLRMRRQARLTDAEPLNLVALMSEASLRQQIGERAVHRQQLEQLADIASNSTSSIELRVLGFDTNPGPLVGSSTLLLMSFATPHLPEVAWQESLRPLGIIDEPNQLSRLTFAFEEGLKGSLSQADTFDIVDRVLRES